MCGDREGLHVPVILLGQLLHQANIKMSQKSQDQFGVGEEGSLKLSLKSKNTLSRSASEHLLASNWPNLNQSFAIDVQCFASLGRGMESMMDLANVNQASPPTTRTLQNGEGVRWMARRQTQCPLLKVSQVRQAGRQKGQGKGLVQEREAERLNILKASQLISLGLRL